MLCSLLPPKPAASGVVSPLFPGPLAFPAKEDRMVEMRQTEIEAEETAEGEPVGELTPVAGEPGTREDELGRRFYSSAWLNDDKKGKT
jgi:hypothetical protein